MCFFDFLKISDKTLIKEVSAWHELVWRVSLAWAYWCGLHYIGCIRKTKWRLQGEYKVDSALPKFRNFLHSVDYME